MDATDPETARRLLARTARLKAAGRLPAPGATPPVVPVALPCVHRGEPTGRTMPCGACGGRQAAVPVLACALHGTCTESRIFAGVTCCKECDDRKPE